MTFSNKINQTRAQLKGYFRKGKIPTETQYAALIDSVVNKVDDGFLKDEEFGFHIQSTGKSKTFASLFPDNNAIDPFFVISKDQAKPKNLKLQPYVKGDDNENFSFYFGANGNLGLGKPAADKIKLEVAGFVGMQGRAGTFRAGKFPADGQWHTIVKDLNNCHAYEVMARAGAKGKGKFALMQATALGVYGKRGSKIKKTRTCYGFCWNHLNLRWIGTTHNYALQIRTNSNYGHHAQIFFKVSQLWNDHEFLDEGYFHKND
ncbi:hypothetical protein [Pedobacter gandavensis]|uniref:Adhesin n=1 Tax=Pedobacter gandavensis TaxID=2679963 RepID=A0ABR6ERS4_9SPHI|nr:hypothetical protein [Pedobacter gandavensis]MBB2147955.1 hypothetical protein [Pedobacter gandavensis]